jgi:cytochrome d ubiquinol oxidase subunit I
MQYPAGTAFNPETARNEMTSFWDVLFSPVAVNKFLHTITSGMVLASIFVIGVSAWYLVRKRETRMALRSITVASVFGLLASVSLALTGDGSAKQIAQVQPMKLAAMEGLYNGKSEAGLVAVGILNGKERREAGDVFAVKLEMPKLLSWMAYGDPERFVAGINDFTKGNPGQGILSIPERVERGKVARQTLADYKNARSAGNITQADSLKMQFKDKAFLDEKFKYFGYGFKDDVDYYVPHVPLTFYSFHIMVILGFGFMVFFALFLFFSARGELPQRKFWLRLAPWIIPLAYIASEAGWIVAELGRQPWTIQDLLPTVAAVTKLETGSVMVTFMLFAVTFTILAIAEVNIMLKAIKHGPKNQGGTK